MIYCDMSPSSGFFAPTVFSADIAEDSMKSMPSISGIPSAVWSLTIEATAPAKAGICLAAFRIATFAIQTGFAESYVLNRGGRFCKSP